MFQPFRQIDGSPTREQRGLGLGLAIVRQLVELHGGTVSARSQGTGTGATFEHVAAVEHGTHQRFLAGAERRVSEMPPQRLDYIDNACGCQSRL